jgi:hypothetical protein
MWILRTVGFLDFPELFLFFVLFSVQSESPPEEEPHISDSTTAYRDIKMMGTILAIKHQNV